MQQHATAWATLIKRGILDFIFIAVLCVRVCCICSVYIIIYIIYTIMLCVSMCILFFAMILYIFYALNSVRTPTTVPRIFCSLNLIDHGRRLMRLRPTIYSRSYEIAHFCRKRRANTTTTTRGEIPNFIFKAFFYNNDRHFKFGSLIFLKKVNG